jgi:Helix-turn-helix
MKIIYAATPFYPAGWIEKSGPPLSANRKQQKALLSLLRELRTEGGLRQVDMAQKLGKPQAFVSYYESGVRRLDLLELRQALGVPLITFIRKFEKRLREWHRRSMLTFLGLY